jgi:hypothetical protein
MIRLVKMWSAALALVVAALMASWFGGRKSAKTDAKTKGLEGYVKTRERMDDVGRLSDADAAADWLRERGKR